MAKPNEKAKPKGKAKLTANTGAGNTSTEPGWGDESAPEPKATVEERAEGGPLFEGQARSESCVGGLGIYCGGQPTFEDKPELEGVQSQFEVGHAPEAHQVFGANDGNLSMDDGFLDALAEDVTKLLLHPDMSVDGPQGHNNNNDDDNNDDNNNKEINLA